MKNKGLTEDQRLLNAALRGDLHTFIKKVFATLNPVTHFKDNWHIEAMAYELSRLSYGDNKRLIINIPPRHLKSISASVAWVAWTLGHAPTARVICVSYSEELAIKLSNDTRKIMMSPWYKDLFPNTIISDKKNTESYFETTAGGFRLATTVGGPLTGLGGDIMVIDDPHKADDARSQVKLKATVDWFRETALSRLDDPNNGMIAVVHQRVHEEDLAGTLIESGGWKHLNLAAIAQHDEEIQINKDQVVLRERGEALHPESMDLEALKRQKDDMGSAVFSAQYLQSPGAIGGEIVKLEWFKRHWGKMRPQHGDYIVQSWDFAYTVSGLSDYTVGLTWLYRNYRFYLLDILRRKVKGIELVPLIRNHSFQWNADTVIMEATGPGLLIHDELNKEQYGKYWRYDPHESKEARLHMHANAVEGGRFYLPHEASWLATFEQELQSFPKGKHDDQVDALSQTMQLTTWLGKYRAFMAPAGMFPDGESDDPESDPYAYIG